MTIPRISDYALNYTLFNLTEAFPVVPPEDMIPEDCPVETFSLWTDVNATIPFVHDVTSVNGNILNVTLDPTPLHVFYIKAEGNQGRTKKIMPTDLCICGFENITQVNTSTRVYHLDNTVQLDPIEIIAHTLFNNEEPRCPYRP
jgi:hypothetical protein